MQIVQKKIFGCSTNKTLKGLITAVQKGTKNTEFQDNPKVTQETGKPNLKSLKDLDKSQEYQSRSNKS